MGRFGETADLSLDGVRRLKTTEAANYRVFFHLCSDIISMERPSPSILNMAGVKVKQLLSLLRNCDSVHQSSIVGEHWPLLTVRPSRTIPTASPRKKIPVVGALRWGSDARWAMRAAAQRHPGGRKRHHPTHPVSPEPPPTVGVPKVVAARRKCLGSGEQRGKATQHELVVYQGVSP